MLDSLVSRQQTQQRSWWKQLLQSSARIKLVDAEKNTTVKNRTQDRDRLQKAPALFTLTAGKTRNKQKKNKRIANELYIIFTALVTFTVEKKNKDTEDSMRMQWTPSAAEWNSWKPRKQNWLCPFNGNMKTENGIIIHHYNEQYVHYWNILAGTGFKIQNYSNETDTYRSLLEVKQKR